MSVRYSGGVTVANSRHQTTNTLGGSLYTNGSGRLTGTGNAIVSAQELGGNDFTIEMWLFPVTNPTNAANDQYIISKGTSFYTGPINPDHSAYHLTIGGTTSGHAGHLIFYMDKTPVVVSSSALPLNTWTHVSIDRVNLSPNNTQGGLETTIFINGAQDAQGHQTTATITSGGTFMIGDYTYFPDGLSTETLGSESYSYKGYIHGLEFSNVSKHAILNGVVFGFTPAKTPTPDSHTTLMLNSVNSANAIVDSSGHNCTFTNNGFTWTSNLPT